MKYLIWDVDGTLYRSNPLLTAELERVNRQFVTELFPDLSPEQGWQKFLDTKRETKSATLAFRKLANISFKRLGANFESAIAKIPYLKEDPRLINMFSKLSSKPGLTSFAFRNGTKAYTLTTLKRLGLGEIKHSDLEFGPFKRVYGAYDDFQTAKPDPKPFKYFRDNLGVPPGDIIWIGDRIEVDLLPAKRLGMKTVLVWVNEVPQVFKEQIDFHVPTVYDVLPLLML